MKCPTCSSENQPDSAFCNKCGSSMQTSMANAKKDSTASSEPRSEPYFEYLKKRPKYLVGIGIGIVVIVLLFFIFLNFNDSGQNGSGQSGNSSPQATCTENLYQWERSVVNGLINNDSSANSELYTTFGMNSSITQWVQAEMSSIIRLMYQQGKAAASTKLSWDAKRECSNMSSQEQSDLAANPAP